MSPSADPMTLSAAAKHTAALLREAQAVQRRLDRISIQSAGEDALTQGKVADALTAARHLVDHLARQERTQRRRLQESLRRPR